MNDKDTKSLFKESRSTVIKASVGIILGGIVTAITLSFTVPMSVASNTEKILNNTTEIKKVITIPVLNQNKIKNIEKDLSDLKDDYKENHKNQEAVNSEIRRANLKIYEILLTIRENQKNK